MSRACPVDGQSLQTPSVLLWLQMARMCQKINRVSGESLRLEGLSCAQFDVLAQVGARDSITQQGLANALFVTKGNVTQLVDRMEKEGLVERVHEGRKNCLRLTETGTLMYQRVVPAQNRLICDMFAALPSESIYRLLEGMRIRHGSIPESNTSTFST